MKVMIIFCFIGVINAKLHSPIVQISSGLIEGQYIESNVTDKPFYSFRGIPYGEPPIGKLRFQPLVKPKPWTITLETKMDGSPCMQGRGGSENCLFLNVYTPALPSYEEIPNLLPVMVYFYGGLFISGSSNSGLVGPEYLIDKKVVLVTLNYRVHIFGFLNTMDEAAPGNVGLKDQLAALEWVQENIEKFSGNKQQVTIFGHSAGSASVQYLLQSKLAKGLFHRAIMQSGSTLNNWGFENNPTDLNQKFGRKLNIDSKNTTEFVNKLQELSSQELYNLAADEALLDDKHRLLRSRFIPSLEYDSPKAYITEYSYSLLAKNEINSVPIMVGYTSNEALIFMDKKYGKRNLDEFEDNPTLLVPKALNINNDVESLQLAWNEIKNHYFKDVPVTNKTAFVNYKSDEAFVRGIRKSIEMLKKENDIYYYIFDYKNKDDQPEYPGVPHKGELKYIFYTGVEESVEDKLVREKMTTLWTNFAKTGNPTPNEDPILDYVKWPKVTKHGNNLQYLDIKACLKISENPGQENMKFWDKIFTKYGKIPFSIY